MMIYKQAIALLSLLFALIVAACDKPEAKPPTNIETGDKSVDDGEEATPAHSFAFDTASHKVAFTSGSTYTKAVVETNKPAGDARAIEYTSSKTKIATVDDAGVVTFVTQGTVTITATKALKGEYPEATARYILYITTKPANKQALADEITRAMDAHGNEVDLNYIDTADITDMSYLFSSDATNGYGRQAFNGDISKWDVSGVLNMFGMFFGATAFDQDISGWNVAKVTNMESMFQDATMFNQDISKWNVARVTNMISMFSGATSFNQDISRWNVAMVTDMRTMFYGATSFNQDISRWNVAMVTDMSYMFSTASKFKQNLDAWGSRINAAVKANGWSKANNMFEFSGLANSLPSWCENVPDCKNKQ